jgi:hypothetical protein
VIKGPLVRSAELDYAPQFYGNPGELFTIGLDFGRASGGDATSATVIKIIPNEGVRLVRNVAVTGMPIPEQATLIKQLWKDYGGKSRGEIVGISLDMEKLGYAICDSLRLSSIDPRDGEELPPLVSVEDYETSNAIRILKPVNFADRTDIYIQASTMKKGLENGTLHLPKDSYRLTMSEAEKQNLSYEDRQLIDAYEEIAELKREMCMVEVKTTGSGIQLSFRTSGNRRDNKKDRFTSMFLASYEALRYYEDMTNQDDSGFVGCVG